MSISGSGPGPTIGLASAVSALRAAAEETRLRILLLLREGELSVSDLTDILGQSQPRISRHLKVLVEAGLVARHREGAWAFFRLADGIESGSVQGLLSTVDREDLRLVEDRERLAAVRARRSEAAQAFFARLAPRWDEVRSLHVAEEAVEAAILDAIGPAPLGSLLDLGTGTGRMLQLLAPQAGRAVGLDGSHAMLSVARARLAREGLHRVELRQGDLHAPPLPRDGFDLVVMHQVLHYLDDPARAVARAARLVAPGGRLLIVDFAPHGIETLRETQAHRRLGFADTQMSAWFEEAGLDLSVSRDLAPPARSGGDRLTVSLWLGRDRRAVQTQADTALSREVA
jgi:ArsR family transcriptional regulator